MRYIYDRHCLDGDWHEITKIIPEKGDRTIDELEYIIKVLDIAHLDDYLPENIVLEGFYDTLSLKRMIEAGEKPEPRVPGSTHLQRDGHLIDDVSVSEDWL